MTWDRGHGRGVHDGRDQRRNGSGYASEASYVVVIGGGQRTRRESDPRAWVEEQKSVSTDRHRCTQRCSLLSFVGVRAQLRAASSCGLARAQERLSHSL
jgi:hypothetical protein